MSGVLERLASVSGRQTLDTPRASRSGYRADIDGLRAVSVLLVVAYHAGVPFVSGGFIGVDVFFVVSGFLITGLLLDEQRGGRLSLPGFYARRVRRLLPLSALVLVSTAAACAVVTAPLNRSSIADDIRSAALYVSNWHFAAQATDYLAANPDHSPVLHYWSLSLEEQFYLVWPLLILAAVAVGRVRALRLPNATTRIAVVLAVLGIGSLVLSVTTTATNGPLAYFGTQTRAWELAAGAGLAMARPVVPLMPRAAAAMGGWAGLALILGSAVVISRDTVFPGVAASFPVLGAVLVLLSGARVATAGVARPLSTSRLQFLGRVSYSWYLWHWPFLVLAWERFGTNGSASTWVTALAVSASLVVAVVSHHLVENPLRRSAWLIARHRRSLLVGLALTMISVLAAGLLARSGGADGVVARPVVAMPGAAPVRLAETPLQARALVQGMRDCHVTKTVTNAAADCTFGNPRASRTIALVGDSHAQQWFPSLKRLADQNGWRLLAWTKNSCLFLDVPIWDKADNREYRECDKWRSNVVSRLKTAGHVDAILVAASAQYGNLAVDARGARIPSTASDRLASAWAAGAARTFSTLQPLADHVIMFKDNPWAPTDIPACLSAAGSDVASCAFPRHGEGFGAGLDAGLVAAARSVAPPSVGWIDFTDLLCTPSVCPAVDSRGLIIYRNFDHMTVAKVLSLRTELAARLAALVPALR